MSVTLYLAIPCYNEETVLPETARRLREKFTALLNPRSRYTPEEGRLNTELRIFALIRLGVSDVNQIADFLRGSPQTIYNYKSKIKKAALNGGDNFEETVRKLGSLSLDAFPSCLPADNA